MPTEMMLPDNHPLMVAWEAWLASEEGKNAMKWLDRPEHREGSMWAAFMWGWQRATEACQSLALGGKP